MNQMRLLLIKFILLSVCIPGFANASKPNDADALKDVNEGKVVWDVTVGNPNKLLKILKVVEETYDDLVHQNVQPEMVFAFRGPAIKLISSQPLNLPQAEENVHKEMLEIIKKLSEKPGVKMESCSIASRLSGIDNKTIISEVKPVGNTFVSLIGYQKKGYSLVPIY